MRKAIWMFFLFSAMHLRAQDFAPLAAGLQHIPSAAVSHPASDGLEVSTTRLDASAAFPVYLNPGGTIVACGVAWQRLSLAYGNLPADNLMLDGHDLFHSVRTPVFVSKKLSAQWSAFTFIIPGIESDFKGTLSWDDFSFQAALIFMREYRAGLRLGYGFFYSRSIGIPAPLPAFTLMWKPAGPWSAQLIVPVRMQLQYNITSGLALGPVFRMTGNQYHGNPEAWDMKEPKLEIRDLTTGLCLTTRPGKWLAAELEGGLAYGRKFEFHDAGNLVLDLKPGSTWYVSCGVQISRPGM